MASVVFTPNLERHLSCPTAEVAAGSVRHVLREVFAKNPRLRGYLLDDQGELRKHVVAFVDGRQLSSKDGLETTLGSDSELYVMQALSGG